MNSAYWVTAGVLFLLLFLVIVGAVNNWTYQHAKRAPHRRKRSRSLRNGDSLRIGQP